MNPTERITPAAISALAALVHELRPEWDRRGIAAAAHKLADQVPARAIAIALIRATDDPVNETPAAVTHFENRAWDSDWYTPCREHPDCRARRPNGECADCYADRQAATEYAIPRRQGVPPAPDVRAQLLDAIHPQRPDTPERATEVDATSATATPDCDATPSRSTSGASS